MLRGKGSQVGFPKCAVLAPEIAAFGGAVLVVPMLIMKLHRRNLTSLLMTSTFVTAVETALAYFMEDAE